MRLNITAGSRFLIPPLGSFEFDGIITSLTEINDGIQITTVLCFCITLVGSGTYIEAAVIKTGIGK